MTDKDFDFINEEDDHVTPKAEHEIATSGNLEEEKEERDIGILFRKFVKKEKKETKLVHRGLTAEVIAEARKLAESKKGLDINTFFIKHQLVNVSLDNLLYGKLDKDGYLLS